MTSAEIEAALTLRIENGGLSWPVAWPNQDAPAAVPLITVEVVPTNRGDATLDGTSPIGEGFVMVKAVTREGVGTGAVNAKADEIAALFPYGLRIPAGSASITIMKPPEPLQGFPADSRWHKPVRITYEVSG